MKSEFVRGVEVAAAVAAQYNGSTTHDRRLDDCILHKLNVGRRKRPRKNVVRLQDPKAAWFCGLAVAIAELHRNWQVGDTEIVAVARGAGLTLAIAKTSGVPSFDWRELKKAGLL